MSCQEQYIAKITNLDNSYGPFAKFNGTYILDQVEGEEDHWKYEWGDNGEVIEIILQTNTWWDDDDERTYFFWWLLIGDDDYPFYIDASGYPNGWLRWRIQKRTDWESDCPPFGTIWQKIGPHGGPGVLNILRAIEYTGAVDFKNTITPPVGDLGNRFIVNRTNTRTVGMMMYTNDKNANWIAQRLLQRAGYAFATISFPANRNIFRLEVGDLFKLNYSPYGITGMVVRIVQIEEDNLDSENITVSVIEDVDYISESAVLTTSVCKSCHPNKRLELLESVKVINAPYHVIGNKTAIIPLVGRASQFAIGYYLYMSIDGGISYIRIATLSSYCVCGSLVDAYGRHTYQIDDGPGIQIDFVNSDANVIDAITRSGLCGFANVALLGNEIITFQTITPILGYSLRYQISGIYRGRLDTEQKNHPEGEDFYFISNTNFVAIENENILPGTVRYFKVVPYSGSTTGNLSDAVAFRLDITGRAKIPYYPINLDANGDYLDESPTYSIDVVLTWDPRLRGDGAGLGSEVFDVNYAPVAGVSGYEGYFRVKVYVNDVLVRTTSAIADFTWTYTELMNITDNGALAPSVTLRVTNYRVESGYEYESAYAEITVTLT